MEHYFLWQNLIVDVKNFSKHCNKVIFLRPFQVSKLKSYNIAGISIMQGVRRKAKTSECCSRTRPR